MFKKIIVCLLLIGICSSSCASIELVGSLPPKKEEVSYYNFYDCDNSSLEALYHYFGTCWLCNYEPKDPLCKAPTLEVIAELFEKCWLEDYSE